MIDSISLCINEYELDNKYSFKEEIPCKIEVYLSNEYKIVGYLRNMRIEIKANSLYISGSLAKWYFGNNIQCLSLDDTEKSIKSLGEAIGIPLEEARVTRIDIGVNIEMKYKPELYFDKLTYLEKFDRNSLKKSSLYFEKYNRKLLFYNKKKGKPPIKYPLCSFL